MKTLRYICVQPAIDYYTWQVEVVIHNFIKNGVNPNHMDIVCSYKGTVPEVWRTLQKTYNNVRFFFYEDTRKDPKYISSIRPHILKKHFEAHPELKDDAILYHDSDIVLTQQADFSHLLDDDVWYLSDTNSYINASYIKSKKFGIYERMCEIVGIAEDIPEKYNEHSGGAQYLMKNIDDAFWEKVEKDSEALYEFFLDHLKAFPQGCLKGYHPIQKWTADMWAVLWNAWYFGHDTKVIKELDFCWPGNNVEQWDRLKIFHNAGVTEKTRDEDRFFFKGDYIKKLPYDITPEDYNPEKCTYKYVQEILETAQKTCLK
jgi:hypothetical protein